MNGLIFVWNIASPHFHNDTNSSYDAKTFSFVSDVLTGLRGHCQPGQKQLGSECICMSPEEDCG